MQLADPIPALGDCKGRVAGQMTFEREFLELSAVEAAEFRRQPAERPNQCELHGHGVSNEAEPRFLCKRQSNFRFALYLAQRVAGEEKVRDLVKAGVCCKCEIADLVRSFERAAQQVTGGPHHP